MENMQKLLEDISACLSHIEEDFLQQVKLTQPVLPRVHNISFREICGFCQGWKITSYVFHDSSHP